MAILRRGNPLGLAWDLVGTGFPDLGADDTIVPGRKAVPMNQSNMSWPNGWTIVCTQGTQCFTGCAGQRFPSTHWHSMTGSASPTCFDWCSQAVSSTAHTVSTDIPSTHHTLVVGRQRGQGCPGTSGPERFHSNATMHRVDLATPDPSYNPGPNAAAVTATWVPLADPMAEPEALPDPLSVPQVPLQPGIAEPSKAPSTAPMPNPDWPVPVATPGTGMNGVNGPTTIVAVRPGSNGVDTDGSSWVLTPTKTPTRPNRKTKEIKVRMMIAGRWVWVKLNSATEALDFIDSMFGALPKKTQFKAFYKVPVKGTVIDYRPIKNYKGMVTGWEEYKRPAKPGETRWTTDPYHKAKAVYDNWEEVNVEVALENFVNNAIEDFMFGNVFNEKIVNQTTGQATGGAGVFGTHDDVVRFKAPTVDIDLDSGSFDLTWDLSTGSSSSRR